MFGFLFRLDMNGDGCTFHIVFECRLNPVTDIMGSIDPHISPTAAKLQIARVAKLRALDPARVQALVDSQTQTPTFGVLGQSRVNVLELNLALDALVP